MEGDAANSERGFCKSAHFRFHRRVSKAPLSPGAIGPTSGIYVSDIGLISGA